jgi:hypothetical protein
MAIPKERRWRCKQKSRELSYEQHGEVQARVSAKGKTAPELMAFFRFIPRACHALKFCFLGRWQPLGCGNGEASTVLQVILLGIELHLALVSFLKRAHIGNHNAPLGEKLAKDGTALKQSRQLPMQCCSPVRLIP